MRRRAITLLLLILFGAAAVWILPHHFSPAMGPAVQIESQRPFVVFDGTLFHSKPDLSRYGVKPLKIIYVSEFGEQWYNSPARMQLPDEHNVKQLAREVGAKESLVAIDIEHWPLTGDPRTVDESLRKYQQIARWFHEAAPALHIGFFGIVPMAAYGWSLKGPESSEYKAWQQINDRLIPLAQEIDVVFPHAYTYYSQPDQTEWVRYAEENIKEARRYGKPVYVYLWFRYETLGTVVGENIPPAFWRLQLETVRKHADGLAIWGGWGANGPESWNEEAPWWQVTKQFMKQLEAAAPSTPSGVKAK